ncbi:DNA cytosine methyltransferase [Streptomyces sp. NPDC048018]|uniref:DNA cytosine methyltransferase n=1 Tax=Streptomyces sp. NPDC048018 TaxID=3365499 RepID=UPI00371E4D1B
MQAIKIVDLFAGPGGLDIAAEKLGLAVTGIEWDDDACATRRKQGLATVHADVREVDQSEFADANVLTGGPPCQTYTVAGSGAGRRALDDVLRCADLMAKGKISRADVAELGDERTALVLEPLRWALEAIKAERPYEAIVLEQVRTVLPVWNAVAEVLEQHGYSVVCAVLKAEEYGVPQTRRRAILIARHRHEAKLPETTHRPHYKGVDRSAGDPTKREWVTMSDVLVKRPKPFTVISNYGTGGDPKLRGRRRHDEPSATVTGKIDRNRVIGPNGTENRFTYPEAGVLQTFPADYEWRGKKIPQQIGNAIPPILAAHVLAAALDLDRETLATAVKDLSGGTITI